MIRILLCDSSKLNLLIENKGKENKLDMTSKEFSGLESLTYKNDIEKIGNIIIDNINNKAYKNDSDKNGNINNINNNDNISSLICTTE